MTSSSAKTTVLVLGATGMLGNAVFRLLSGNPALQVHGSIRSARSAQHFDEALRPQLVADVDVENLDRLMQVFAQVRPQVVVNCIGLIKQLADAKDPLAALPVNAILPHRLARLCGVAGARLVHLSTDCVFSGRKGMYTEADFPDADDLYGRSKLLGEVDYPHAVTLRTSIIGTELNSAHSLVGWFLAQSGSVRGFKKAIFSGLPTVEIARIIQDHVIPNPALRGLYHVSAEPINKFDLLTLVAAAYGKTTQIEPYEDFAIDRSLDSTRFRTVTGYTPPAWDALVKTMRDFA